jgi:aryl-alcohol dehydrogenase-like predicted oxidoreductase
VVETRRIGSLEASVVGLGCNNFGKRIDAAATAAVVQAALDAGINHFDTADLYADGRSEELLGRALGARRKEVIVATKFGHPSSVFGKGGKPEHVRRALEGSLRRLGTDYVDLYWIHKPDPETPIADTLGALDDLVRQGKVREIGCSNFNAAQLREAEGAVRAGGARFVALQNEYSLLHREPEEGVLDECERLDVGLVPYFPLASGLLTGKYRKGRPLPEGTRITQGGSYSQLLSERNLDVVEELVRFAESRGHTILDLAFAWLLAHSVVTSVIAGATKPEQVRGNVAAARWRLTDAERAEVDAVTADVGSSAA